MVDEGIRHIYINNEVLNPTTYVGQTNPIKRSAAIYSLIGSYKSCKPLRSGSLLLEVNTFEQLTIMISLKTFMNIPVNNKLAYDIGTVKGYAWDDRLKDMGTEALKAIWKTHNVIKVDRNFIEQDGIESFNGSLIITFKSDELPKSLPIGDEYIKIQKFRKNVLQCKKCHLFYHMINQCRKTEYHCSDCGKVHDSENGCNEWPK